MELSINAKGGEHTKTYTRKDFSLTSLFKPLLSFEKKVTEFLVSSLETKSLTPSSKTLIYP